MQRYCFKSKDCIKVAQNNVNGIIMTDKHLPYTFLNRKFAIKE